MEKEFAKRRNIIRNELEKIKNDADHWNRTHPNEEPIIIDLNLTLGIIDGKKEVTEK